MDRDMTEKDTPKSGLRFSPDIRLGDLVGVVGAIGAVMVAWGNLGDRFGRVEAAQAAQAVQGQRLDANIREVKDEVKATGQDVRDLRSRMDRARM